MFKEVLIPAALCFSCACGSDSRDGRPAPDPRPAPAFALTSGDIADKVLMPSVFTCDGGNVSPALEWSGAPAGTKSFALTMKDPDAPGGDFLHWAVVDIPAGAVGTARNAKFPPASRELRNGAGGYGYFGPCPPSGTHRYVFTLYALDTDRFDSDPARLEEFLSKHAVARAALTGLYKRK